MKGKGTMKNVKEYTGELRIIKRMKNSPNGNPRYVIAILNENGKGPECRTRPDDMLSYGLPNYEGQTVTVAIGTHYGINTLSDIIHVLDD